MVEIISGERIHFASKFYFFATDKTQPEKINRACKPTRLDSHEMTVNM
jgi:hypothetical protein